jgi:O-antigen ligase
LIFFFLITFLLFFTHAPISEKNSLNIKNDDVLAGRSLVWNTTIESARLSPFLGIGIDNRALVTKSDIKKSIEARNDYFDESLYDFHNKHSHSFYLTNIAERGILGALVTIQFILMWIIFLKKTFRLCRSGSEGILFWSGSFSSFLATFGIGFVNTTFHHEHGILACLFLGLHLAFVNKLKPNFKN